MKGMKDMTTNQKLYFWHEARMTMVVVVSGAIGFMAIYATSPWLRGKCHDVKDKITNKFHKKQK